MKRVKRFSLLLTLVLGILAAAALADGRRRFTGGYGMELVTDLPAYAGGDTAQLRYRISNRTPVDVLGCCLRSYSGFCAAAVQVRDLADRVVWEPGTIFCSPVDLLVPLPSGGRFGDGLEIPLVYGSRSPIGSPGAPLDPGVYTIRLRFNAMAPYLGSPSGAAGFFSAEVPIRILEPGQVPK